MKPSTTWKLPAFAFLALFAFWVLLSGQFTPFLLAAGAASSVLVVWLAMRMEVIDREGMPAHFWHAVFTYWPWLAWQIVKSAWQVTRLILDPRLPVSPTLVRFRPSQRSSVGLVTHANSITLTPGTITVEASPGEFLVHGLTRAGAEACIDSDMDRRIARLER
jgi:multicomponent Na+:H+ antiporter subunit E